MEWKKRAIQEQIAPKSLIQPGEHFCCDTADSADPNDDDGVVADALVLLDYPHALQGHQPTVRVGVHHLRKVWKVV